MADIYTRGINKYINYFLIFITCICVPVSCVDWKRYKNNQGLTLWNGTLLRNDSGVSIIQCLFTCEHIEDCCVILWNKPSSSCSYHHWMIPGTTPGGYKSLKLSYGPTDDHVVLVKPIPIFMMDGDYSFSFTSGEAYCISMGATMASLEQLTAAKDSGFFRCACGYVTNGIAYYPMTYAVVGCSNSAGIHQCGSTELYNVFCTTT